MSFYGKEFETIKSEFNRVDVSNLPPGIYLITYTTEGKTISRKFIKN